MGSNKQINEAKEVIAVAKNLIEHLELLVNNIASDWTHEKEEAPEISEASSSSNGWFTGK